LLVIYILRKRLKSHQTHPTSALRRYGENTMTYTLHGGFFIVDLSWSVIKETPCIILTFTEKKYVLSGAAMYRKLFLLKV